MSGLRYLPLGGLGEVGINMWALEWEDQVLVVDAGLMFPQEDMLGIDLVLPDISYLLEKRRKVLGIFLSHGHEDHIGGLPYALKKINVPVYGTRLTLGLVKPKLKEHRILREADLREVRVGDTVQLGPFRVETVAVCHSIPDAVALAIQTPVGRVVYTSDFKLDPDPPDGHPTDMERFRRLGDEGVRLLLSDSTNAERSGRSGSERDLHRPFERIFGEAPGRIVVANFASNIHRIQHLVRMAVQFDRKVAVVGRSLQTNFKTARELGFLKVPEGLTVQLENADKVAPSKLLLLTAGSQGEPMSALARFAAQRHPLVNVLKGDWVVISARPIPGNERMVHQTVNNLYRHGAHVFYSEVGHVHVTGHAQRDESRARPASNRIASSWSRMARLSSWMASRCGAARRSTPGSSSSTGSESATWSRSCFAIAGTWPRMGSWSSPSSSIATPVRFAPVPISSPEGSSSPSSPPGS